MHASEQAGSSSWTSAGKRKREVSDDGSGVSATQVAFALQKHRRVEVIACCHRHCLCCVPLRHTVPWFWWHTLLQETGRAISS